MPQGSNFSVFRLVRTSVLLVLALACSGCQVASRAPYVSTQVLSSAEWDASARKSLWMVIQDTLREHRFELDRVDIERGVVTTFPVISQHFFECWRHDVDTRHDLWEATLNPIRRWVKVSVGPSGNDGETTLVVSVFKQRLSSYDRQYNSTGAAYQYFGSHLPSTTGLTNVSKEQDQWLDIGHDPAMESRLLRLMVDRFGSKSTSG